MRKHAFIEGEFYHIYCHGAGDRSVFRDKHDFERFMLLLFLSNSEQSIPRFDRTSQKNLTELLRDEKSKFGEVLVDIVCFCLLASHFHLLLRERGDGSISRYLHKILVSHSKYLNRRWEKRGHVFESTFHSRHIDTNRYLLYVSKYIHKNPHDDKKWRKKESHYPWSSYQDFVHYNRWGKRLAREVILEQFDDVRDYLSYVEEPMETEEYPL